jgi:predicted RNA-binding Zn-ribbon protein involved in translation (DUF1610 family)
MLLLSAAIVVALIYLTQGSPIIGYSCVAVTSVLLVMAGVSEIRARRQRRMSEARLAALACPACGTSFGVSVAHAAFNPPPPPLDLMEDDFGLSSVTCPKCGTEFLYHRKSREITLGTGTDG